MNIVALASVWPWDLNSSTERPKISVEFLSISITIISLIFLIWNLKKSKKLNPPLPPGPRGLPLVGYLPFLDTFLHKTFTELAGMYGPIYKFWLANKLCVVISSSSLAREVLRDKDKIFANRDPPIAAKVITYGENDIAWSSYSPEWSKMRKVFVREMLSNSNLDACYPLRKQEVEKAIKDVFKKADSKVAIDFGEMVFEISANSAIRMLCGGTVTGEKAIRFFSEFRRLAAELMVLLGKPNISDYFPVLARFDLQGIRSQTTKILSCFDEILNSVIQQRLHVMDDGEEEKRKIGKKDFLQILLDLNNNVDSEISITTNQLKAMLLDIVVGGTDTSATMLEWAMAELMGNQEAMKKVYQELDQVVGFNKKVEEFHLPKLKYLDAVIKETFRLHPALPVLVPHFSSQSCTLGGYTIPKGTTLFVNVYAIHRDPLFWDNPSQFVPERFMVCSDSKIFDFSGNNFHYLPFGSGRRVCAGLPLAERMVMYVLASFLHLFEWKLPEDAELDFSEKCGIVIKKMKPLILVPKPRLSNIELY